MQYVDSDDSSIYIHMVMTYVASLVNTLLRMQSIKLKTSRAGLADCDDLRYPHHIANPNTGHCSYVEVDVLERAVTPRR